MKRKEFFKNLILYTVVTLVIVWFLLPIVLITISAFAVPEDYDNPQM